ncbi:aspartate--tRNA ligase [Candidatus Uhrbacteria bacterium]|jgi:aspartyl-tRNA synthetase|nr:aspartate--tRNA ligase [Candidatus Uhrbacteria bacterium]MBT7716792.1 aspartate--tRNA ligase [Candidatus Uhrbacteria bacterium]
MKRIFTSETVGKAEETVKVAGWIHARRDMGKIMFFDLRDKDGLLQIVGVPADLGEEGTKIAETLRPEWVVEIEGVVQKRGERQINNKIPTGTVELLAKKITVLNEAKTPPFELDKDTSAVGEDVRLKYRYLDLRSERMATNIRNRNKVFQAMRQFLSDKDFIEIETPQLTKGTPEGSREFIVPSRLHPENFYVLPQAPQQFKQLLMTSGVERYFQMAKCFRDEDQRGDRQPEFTQMDLEMSFVQEEDVIGLIEEMMIKVVENNYPEKKIQQKPFPRMSYAEAMEKYGNDRPDLREDKDDPNLLAFCWVVDFPFFEKDDNGGPSTGSGQSWTFTHNPFSAAKPEFESDLLEKKNVENIIAPQFDIILNGFEVGGGSIRNHKPELLKAALEIMGFEGEQIEAQFGTMLQAFEYGAPPHGGLALGMDRIMAILQNEPNIREVIAFPKDGSARDLMMDAPSALSEKALSEANIEIKK